MFKAIGWILKTALFAALVLVLGQVIRWNGRTLSDQVRMGLSSAEPAGRRLVSQVKDWTGRLAGDAREGSRRPAPPRESRAGGEPQDRKVAQPEADIPGSERQKLRALIRELNDIHQD